MLVSVFYLYTNLLQNRNYLKLVCWLTVIGAYLEIVLDLVNSLDGLEIVMTILY